MQWGGGGCSADSSTGGGGGGYCGADIPAASAALTMKVYDAGGCSTGTMAEPQWLTTVTTAADWT